MQRAPEKVEGRAEKRHMNDARRGCETRRTGCKSRANDARRGGRRYGRQEKIGVRAHNAASEVDWLKGNVEQVARNVMGRRERAGGKDQARIEKARKY